MKTAYHILMHLMGVACIAACIAIVATLGSLDLHWAGWLAVAFFALMALGIVTGWFPWRGAPLRVMIKGFYVMSALALIGFGFSMTDPFRPQLWMILAALAAAIALRMVIRVVMHGRGDEPPIAPEPPPRRAPADDPFFN
jgi:hypothetical protein